MKKSKMLVGVFFLSLVSSVGFAMESKSLKKSKSMPDLLSLTEVQFLLMEKRSKSVCKAIAAKGSESSADECIDFGEPLILNSNGDTEMSLDDVEIFFNWFMNFVNGENKAQNKKPQSGKE